MFGRMQFQRPLAFYLYVLFVSLVSLPLAAQWTNVAPNLLGSINQIETGCITAKSGIIWAGVRELWMSSDFGATWTKRSPFLIDNTDRIKAIHFYDENIGGVVTHNGYFFLTRDQGLTWQQPLRTSSGTGVAILSPPEHIVVAAGTTGEVAVTHDGGLNWKVTKLGSYIADVKPLLGSSAYLLQGFKAQGKDTSEMHVMRTTDFGDQWTTMPGEVDFDTYSFDCDPCNPAVLFVANEDGRTTRDSLCQIFRSTDFGISWQSLGERSNRKGSPRHYYSGSISLTSQALFVQTVADGILRSTDMGTTWQNIGGPSATYDTRLLFAVSGNLVIAADNNGSIWRTTSSGGDSLGAGSQYQLLSSFPRELFVTDSLRICDSPVVSTIYLFSSFCKTPRIIDQTITGTDSLDYRLLQGVSDSLTGNDSVLISFKPSSAGNKHGYYTITLEDGTKLSFPLKGHGRGLKFVGSATLDASTDTIGGYVSVPLQFTGLDRAQDIGLVIHYEPSLIYLGSFTNDGSRIDVPGETWKEGSRLMIEGEKLRLDSASGFSYFAVYPRRGEPCYSVSFDSLTILDSNSKCEYVLGTGINANICPPKGCSIMMLTDFILQGVVPELILHPNPSSGRLTLISQDSLGAGEFTVFDNGGRKLFTTYIDIQRSTNIPIDLAHLPSGNYVANIVGAFGRLHHRIHILK